MLLQTRALPHTHTIQSSFPSLSCIPGDPMTGSHSKNMCYHIQGKVVKRAAFSTSSLSACSMQRLPQS